MNCGNATRTRSRACTHPSPMFGGLTCAQQDLGDSEDVQSCKNQAGCPSM